MVDVDHVSAPLSFPLTSALSELPFATERSLLGDSAGMRTVRALLSAVVASDAPLVLTGERGTGKVRIARWLHANGPRANGPLVVVHCAALPVMTIEEHLLGRSGTPGALARAAGGTLVLDGLDALPARMQVSLLRALTSLEHKAPQDRPRFISTLVDTPALAIRAGRLREDLRFRLGVFTVAMPALRERKEDIVVLADELIRRASARRGRKAPPLAQNSREQALTHHWPGNIAELETAIEHALDDVDADPAATLALQLAVDPGALFAVEVTRIESAPTLEEVEVRYIHHILRLVGGNKTRAADVLQVDRRTLYRRLARTTT
jgi:DNA-binding NtrC family response regulator